MFNFVPLSNDSNKKHTWTDECIRLLKRLGGAAKLSEIYREFELHGMKPKSENWKSHIRDALERGCPESNIFDGRAHFAMVEGKGRGVYKLIGYTEPSESDSSVAVSFNEARLSQIIEAYARHIKNPEKHWQKEESFKWQALRDFREFWDIEAEDFKSMFEKSFQQVNWISIPRQFDSLA